MLLVAADFEYQEVGPAETNPTDALVAAHRATNQAPNAAHCGGNLYQLRFTRNVYQITSALNRKLEKAEAVSYPLGGGARHFARWSILMNARRRWTDDPIPRLYFDVHQEDDAT